MKEVTLLFVALAMVFFFSASGFSRLKGDFDSDGDVGAYDLVAFSENFGKTDNICKDNDNCISSCKEENPEQEM